MVPNVPPTQPPAFDSVCPYPTGSPTLPVQPKANLGPGVNRNSQLPMPEPPQPPVPIAGQAFQTGL